MQAKYIKFAICLLFSIIFVPAAQANLHNHHAPTPGGVAIIKLKTTEKNFPKVTYQGNQVLTLKNPDCNNKAYPWVAVVGIPLSVAPGKQAIKLHTTDGVKKIEFKVKPKKYQTQRINFKGYRPATKKSKLLIALEARIEHETKEMQALFRQWLTNHKPTKLQLDWPVKGRISGGFGVRRIFNGQEKNPHSGLDIAAPAGTAVRAPKDGVVIKTKHYYLPGNSVFIDHGHGFITCYFHLKKISVAVGKKIKRGDVIGLVGKTGRATGPHLHWSVSLNGVRVDPELFLPKRQKAK